MTLEEYKAKAEQEEDWSPGWEAVDNCFDKLYPGQEPFHFATLLTARAMLGGDNYLDGYSIYTSPGGYRHIVTYGMSELYTNPESFGGEYSKWGYEMTMKLVADTDEDCRWALSMLSNLARYTFQQSRFFEPGQYISGGGNPIKQESDTALTGLLAVADTEVQGIDTIHGRLEFVQLVGITQPELEALMEQGPDFAPVLIQALQQDYPQLQTDLSRTKSYL